MKFTVFALLLVVVCSCPLMVSCQKKGLDVKRNGILIDAIHANDFSDKGLEPENYNYHEINGFRHGFEYLKTQGIRCDIVREGRLTSEQLAGYQMLFINLVSAERPPFLVSEIRAIVDFVDRGGSLFLITDHSNCYFHAYRLEPLLTELGIESPTDMLCEIPPKTLANGNAWLFVDHFTQHPLTENLRHIAMQTGGRVDSRYALAWSTENSWADAWANPLYGEGKNMGLFGNYTYDDGTESRGPFGIVLGKEFGKGRIIIVADQNLFSDTFLNYLDNYRLWFNAIGWGLHDAKIPKQAQGYLKWKNKRLWLVESLIQPAFGSDASAGLYNFATLVSRYFWVFSNDRHDCDADLAILPGGFTVQTAETVADLVKLLKNGKKLLILQESPHLIDMPDNTVKQILDQCHITDYEIVMKNELEAIEIPGGGTIYFAGISKIFNNSFIDEPTIEPYSLKQEPLREVVTLIESILDFREAE